MKVIIAGGPRVGKSTLFRKLALHFPIALGTDDFMGFSWGDVPDAIIRELDGHHDWLLEGVNAVRVIRRWMKIDPDFAPDVIYYLTQPMADRTPKHWSMAKAIDTQWRSIRDELQRKGVHVITEVERAA